MVYHDKVGNPIEGGETVELDNLERRAVIEVVDYSQVEDGGKKEVYAILRFCDGDPRRRIDAQGGDIYVEAIPVAHCKVVS